MPNGLTLVRTTPEFNDSTVPQGLLAAHQVAAGVWGRLRVLAGSLRFVFEAVPSATFDLEAGEHVDIPPATAHRVELLPGCRFVVEFHRDMRSAAADPPSD